MYNAYEINQSESQSRNLDDFVILSPFAKVIPSSVVVTC